MSAGYSHKSNRNLDFDPVVQVWSSHRLWVKPVVFLPDVEVFMFTDVHVSDNTLKEALVNLFTTTNLQ